MFSVLLSLDFGLEERQSVGEQQVIPAIPGHVWFLLS